MDLQANPVDNVAKKMNVFLNSEMYKTNFFKLSKHIVLWKDNLWLVFFYFFFSNYVNSEDAKMIW